MGGRPECEKGRLVSTEQVASKSQHERESSSAKTRSKSARDMFPLDRVRVLLVSEARKRKRLIRVVKAEMRLAT